MLSYKNDIIFLKKTQGKKIKMNHSSTTLTSAT
jgi:hypothetical protein